MCLNYYLFYYSSSENREQFSLCYSELFSRSTNSVLCLLIILITWILLILGAQMNTMSGLYMYSLGRFVLTWLTVFGFMTCFSDYSCLVQKYTTEQMTNGCPSDDQRLSLHHSCELTALLMFIWKVYCVLRACLLLEYLCSWFKAL